MDSISLNITSAPQPLRSKTMEKPTPVRTPKKKFNSAPNGFSFEFGGGGHKVKALVARRRQKFATASAPTTPIASAAGKMIAKQSVGLRRKSVADMGAIASAPETTMKAAASSKIKTSAFNESLSLTTLPSVPLPRKSLGNMSNVVPRENNTTQKPLPTPRKLLSTEAASIKASPKSKAFRRKSVAGPLQKQNLPPMHPPRPARSMALKHKSVVTKNTTPKFVNQTHYESDNDSDLESFAKAPSNSVGGEELMLNVFTKSGSRETAKPKLTRMERMNQKRMQRKGTGPLSKRTLSQREIKEGLRKFSENPNKKPRAGDLLDRDGQPIKPQEENKAGNTEKITELIAQESIINIAQEPKLGVVDPIARKSNAFRVKRPEDSSIKKINLFTKNPEAKVLGQRLVRPIVERIFDGTKVESLPLHPHCVKNLLDILSITELTTVQQKTIPKALEGKDLLVRSQTGSGKTLAYALPVVEKLQEIRPKLTRDAGILAVVIVPTRELAIQTYELFQKLLKPFTWIVSGVLMGGERRKAEKARLRKGINVLVGTPGRLVDHLLHTETFKLCKAKFLILDEADRLLEMGYERDVKQIVEAIDKQRQQLAVDSNEEPPRLQRLLLSATLTTAVQKLAGLTLHEPIFIDNSDEDPSKAIKTPGGIGYNKETIEEATANALEEDETGILTIPENLQLSFVVVPTKLRLVTFAGLLAKEFIGKKKFKAMVFMSTMEMVNFHHDLLNEQLTRKVLDEEDEEATRENEDSDDGEQPLLKGLRFFRLHGSMSQTERQGVFKGFRDCSSGVLLATDVVGRGIDIQEVDLVVQYSPPQKTCDFVHRVGRTARAGRSGRAVLFLAPSEAMFVRTLEDKRIRISQVDMDIYLKALLDNDDEAKNIQEAASNLQHKFQELIADDKELHEKACKAFVSWMKFYSTFPRELKSIFNIKDAHMGHFAKSFGLKDRPTSFTKKHSAPKAAPPTNRLTYTERDPMKIEQQKHTKKRLYTTTVTGEKRNTNSQHHGLTNKLLRMLPTSRALNTSEFDSGIPAKKQKAK